MAIIASSPWTPFPSTRHPKNSWWIQRPDKWDPRFPGSGCTTLHDMMGVLSFYIPVISRILSWVICGGLVLLKSPRGTSAQRLWAPRKVPSHLTHACLHKSTLDLSELSKWELQLLLGLNALMGPRTHMEWLQQLPGRNPKLLHEGCSRLLKVWV